MSGILTAGNAQTPTQLDYAKFWPADREILLLIAALAPLDDARRAWAEWSSQREIDQATSGEVRLLAMVARRMDALGASSKLLPRLTGVRKYIYTRTQLTFAKSRPALKMLSDAGVKMMLLKGAAIVAIDPDRASERGLSDVDILVHPDDFQRAVQLILDAGWTPPGKPPATPGGDHNNALFEGRHSLGLAPPNGTNSVLDIHKYCMYMCRNLGDDESLWSRARQIQFMGMPFWIPSGTDMAVHSLAHASLFTNGIQYANWALDILPAMRARHIDWTIFAREVTDRQVQAFVVVPLMLISEKLKEAPPQYVMNKLCRQIDTPALGEFTFLSTHFYGTVARPAKMLPVRQMAVRRSELAARKLPPRQSGPVGKPTDFPLPPPPNKLPAGRKLTINLPEFADPRQRLRVTARFQVPNDKNAVVILKSSGMILDSWSAAAANQTKLASEITLRFNILVSFFAMRGAKTVFLLYRGNDPLSQIKLTASLLPAPPARSAFSKHGLKAIKSKLRPLITRLKRALKLSK